MAGLKFRVLIDTKSSNEIFRDILIDDQATFEEFYEIIYKAFDFSGNQMASFYVSDDDWEKGHEISFTEIQYDEHDTFDDIPDLMNNTKIHQFIEAKDQKFILLYDFLVMWIFLIELIGYEETNIEEPKVILKIGEAPKENSRNSDDIQMEAYGMDLDEGDFDDEHDELDDDFESWSEETEYDY